jgi:DNA-binding protein HU-beta
MTKKELINLVNQKIDTRFGSNIKRVEATLDALGVVAQETLTSGGEVPFPGLGKLVVVATKAREGRNPKSGKPIEIAARRKVKFRQGKELTEALKA